MFNSQMTLQDQLAAHALAGIIPVCTNDTFDGTYEDYAAEKAYKIARAMMRARSASSM